MNNDWEDKVRDKFSELKQSQQISDCVINGFNIKIFPNVFSPAIFFESGWFAEKLSAIVGKKSLLEIGTGTGVISLFSALGGAEVTAIDINDTAVENARLNFKENNVEVKTYVGSVYEPLGESDKFDFIFWNHPFNNTDKKDEDVFLKSVFDYRYEHLENYISNAKYHLTPNGRLLLGTSNIANLDGISEIAKKYDYDFKLLEKIDRKSEVDELSTDFRICEFVKLSVQVGGPANFEENRRNSTIEDSSVVQEVIRCVSDFLQSHNSSFSMYLI